MIKARLFLSRKRERRQVEPELVALIILTSIPQFGSVKIRALIQKFGSCQNVLNASAADLRSIAGFSPKTLETWDKVLMEEKWKKDLVYIDQHAIQVTSFREVNYPSRLLQLPDFPLVLYHKGSLGPSNGQSLSIVGTRNASLYGTEMARNLSRELSSAGFTIVSGLARGIDTAAHQGALEGGRTLAILGSGLAQVYPNENRELAEEISKRGAIVSEFSVFTPPDRLLFPQRNRIISGMTLGTILIEAPLKSGSMLTMNRAYEQNRMLFALPGRADLDNFKGNHQLIKERKAALIEESADVLKAFNQTPTSIERKSLNHMLQLDEDEELVYGLFAKEEQSIHEILHKTQLPMNKLNFLLMSLVLKNAIKEYPGKIYKKSLA